eukprot:11034834-Heterocapsa_arctica.AAC.1
MAALQGDLSDVRERSASALTRDSASLARAIMALEAEMALHNSAAEQTEKRLNDLNNQYVKDIAALNVTITASVCDREVTDKVLVENAEQIKMLTSTISVAMEVDTDDVE